MDKLSSTAPLAGVVARGNVMCELELTFERFVYFPRAPFVLADDAADVLPAANARMGALTTGAFMPFPPVFVSALLTGQLGLITEAHVANLITRIAQAMSNQALATATSVSSLPDHRMWVALVLMPVLSLFRFWNLEQY